MFRGFAPGVTDVTRWNREVVDKDVKRSMPSDVVEFKVPFDQIETLAGAIQSLGGSQVLWVHKDVSNTRICSNCWCIGHMKKGCKNPARCKSCQGEPHKNDAKCPCADKPKCALGCAHSHSTDTCHKFLPRFTVIRGGFVWNRLNSRPTLWRLKAATNQAQPSRPIKTAAKSVNDRLLHVAHSESPEHVSVPVRMDVSKSDRKPASVSESKRSEPSSNQLKPHSAWLRPLSMTSEVGVDHTTNLRALVAAEVQSCLRAERAAERQELVEVKSQLLELRSMLAEALGKSSPPKPQTSSISAKQVKDRIKGEAKAQQQQPAGQQKATETKASSNPAGKLVRGDTTGPRGMEVDGGKKKEGKEQKSSSEEQWVEAGSSRKRQKRSRSKSPKVSSPKGSHKSNDGGTDVELPIGDNGGEDDPEL
jgi:hypothetical protein